MIAFNELINACHNDLALFASHVIEFIKTLLNDKLIDFKGLGTDTVRESKAKQSETNVMLGDQQN